MMRVYAATAAVAVAALLGVTVYVTTGDEDQFAQCRGSAVGTGAASIGGPFELVDENGTTVTDKDLITKPTLIYFGYTFCPDVCPLDSARNAEALDLLQSAGYDAQLAFITIDPERDGVEEVRDFTDYLHEDMIGLTGTQAQIRAASKAYKTYYRKQDGDPEYYLMDHSTFTYFVTPKSGFLEFFKRDDTAQDMAERVGCFIDAEG